MVPARVLLYSWRSVKFGMAECCAHVDGMLPATHQTPVSVARLGQAPTEPPEGCTWSSLTCQAVVGKGKVLGMGEPRLPFRQLSLHRGHSQPMVSMLQHTCTFPKEKNGKLTVRLLEDKSR